MNGCLIQPLLINPCSVGDNTDGKRNTKMTKTKASTRDKHEDSVARCDICTSPAQNGRATSLWASPGHTPSLHPGSCGSIFCVPTYTLSGSSQALCLLAPYPEVGYLHIHLLLSAPAPSYQGRRAWPGLEHQPAGPLRAVPGSVGHRASAPRVTKTKQGKTKRRKRREQ